MKFVIFFVVIGVVYAELPRFRPARFRPQFQRQELAPTTTDSPTEPTTEDNAPYPASGWKPSQPFALPQEKPDDSYGAPQKDGPYPASGWKPSEPFELPREQPPSTSYGVPDNTYGAPDNTYGAPYSTDAPTTGKPQAERQEGPVDVQKSVGTYYVLLPNGQLQKVDFATENDVQNMKYVARLQLSERAPLLLFRP